MLTTDRNQAISTWTASLQVEASTWLEVLVNEEADRTLRRSDMDKLLELALIIPEGICASEQPGLGQDRCATVLRAFYSSLLTTVAPPFDRLTDSSLREATRKQSAIAVSNAYNKVFDMISNPANKYDVSTLTHSKDEVRVIVGCE